MVHFDEQIAPNWDADNFTVDWGETDVWVWEVRKWTDENGVNYLVQAHEKPLYNGLFLREKSLDPLRCYNILAHILEAKTIEAFFERHGVDVAELRKDPLYWINREKGIFEAPVAPKAGM